MNNMNKRNLIIVGIIIILALGVGSFWYVSNSQKSKVESQKLGTKTNAEKQEGQVVKQGEGQEQKDVEGEKEQVENQGQETSQKQSNTNSDIKYNPDGTIDTSDWKTYRNEELGFELKYPQFFVYKVMEDKNGKNVVLRDKSNNLFPIPNIEIIIGENAKTKNSFMKNITKEKKTALRNNIAYTKVLNEEQINTKMYKWDMVKITEPIGFDLNLYFLKYGTENIEINCMINTNKGQDHENIQDLFCNTIIETFRLF